MGRSDPSIKIPHSTISPVRVTIRWNQEAGVSQPQFVDLLKTFGDLLPDPLSGRLNIAAYASKLLERADICFAFEGDRIVGLLAIYTNDRKTFSAHIPLLSVLPSHQGRGLGRTLMSRSLALARQRDMRRVWLEVNPDNYRAESLYRSFGFSRFSAEGASNKMQLYLAGIRPFDPSSITPIHRVPRLAAALGLNVDLWLKRDDLYPMPGGGIKARKIEYIVRHAMEEGYDALVTNGGPQSNHARATAVVAAALGLRCHLVIVLKPGQLYSTTGNLLLMKLSGASIEYCGKEALPERMDRAMDHFADRGHKPLYIWGGGHCLQGTIAFVDAAKEAMQQCGDWHPDFVVAASGTGTTQAGLAIGYAGTPTRVIGISVARSADTGRRILLECVNDYFHGIGLPAKSVEVDFRDDWTEGGYEHYSADIFQVIERGGKAGVFFDPTYSGKALRGLVDLVRRGDIEKDSRVLFWHTGGLMNLQAVGHYMDHSIKL